MAEEGGMVDWIRICGGYPLCGECRVQGSKNAVLPILAAAVLTEGTVILDNCPRISDADCMISLLQSVGCRVYQNGGTITIDSASVSGYALPEAYVSKMRSSVTLMGSLLGRQRKVVISHPGGCVIGKRPIDLHLQAFSQMGVILKEEGHMLTGDGEGLHGAEITLPFPSVGATENIILAAVLADGETVLKGAAKEPEITALCEFLVCIGAKICSRDDCIRIQGVKKLRCGRFRIPPDRIAAGTYLLGCMAAGGEICLRDVKTDELTAVLSAVSKMGGICHGSDEALFLKAPERPLPIPYLKTAVYPGYPTDLQSPLLAVLALAEGESCIEEDIFENRFRVVPQLRRMGADISIRKNRVKVQGVKRLMAKKVTAKELRGGAALVLAALAAEGETLIRNRRFIDRGYEDIVRDIKSLQGRTDVM